MNAPYCGKFKMTQTQHPQHDGYDLVGIDSKEIHATASGRVVYAGWENPNDHTQGFGQYVVIESNKKFYHYGHLSEIKTTYGATVNITDVIGIEGSTGRSTGSHCHYCVRTSMNPGTALDLASVSGIPNALGEYDDGYRPGAAPAVTITPGASKKEIEAIITIEGHKYSGLLAED